MGLSGKREVAEYEERRGRRIGQMEVKEKGGRSRSSIGTPQVSDTQGFDGYERSTNGMNS